jgi:hypothetical protein
MCVCVDIYACVINTIFFVVFFFSLYNCSNKILENLTDKRTKQQNLGIFILHTPFGTTFVVRIQDFHVPRTIFAHQIRLENSPNVYSYVTTTKQINFSPKKKVKVKRTFQ